MTDEERKIYIRQKAVNRVINKLKRQNRIIKELRLSC
jgi:hypothetical protein